MTTRDVKRLGVAAAAALTLVPAVAAAEGDPVIARALTLPRGGYVVGLDSMSNRDFSAMDTKLVAGYGVHDRVETVVSYVFATREFESAGSVDAVLGYAIVRGAAGGRLEIVPRAQVGYDMLAGAVNPMLFGAQVQLNLTPSLAVITPGGQVAVGVDGEADGTTTVGLPVAVAYQASNEVYFQLDTSLASLHVSHGDHTFIGCDATPLALTAVYNPEPAIDLLATFGLDATPAEHGEVGETMSFLVGARYSL